MPAKTNCLKLRRHGQKFPDEALKLFETILAVHPASPRAVYGRAASYEKLAELRKNNAMLETAIGGYKRVMAFETVPDRLYLMAATRCANRMQFRGMLVKTILLLTEVVKKFPDHIESQTQLAVTYLMSGNGQQAKKILQEVLKKHPDNGFVKVHLGFILKTEDKQYPEAIKLLEEGLETKEAGVIDGRFYFHLGDALTRTGQPERAMAVYGEAAKAGIFLSALQRSLYNVNGLTAKPWWESHQTPYLSEMKKLENNWQIIKKEALSLMNDKRSGFEPESEGLQDTGDWQQFNLYIRGNKIEKNCKLAPKTCALIDQIPDAAKCKRGQAKFSIMQPGTHVWAHTGPTNCRLRTHLGLVVPQGTRMRVGNVTRSWSEGKILIFDDSFDHEV